MTQILVSAAFNHSPIPSSAVKTITSNQKLIRSTTPLFLSDSNNSRNDYEKTNKQQQKYLSASQQARRAEVKRRQIRQKEGFATPGISSAIPGAQNLPIDIAKTEREYMASLMYASGDDSDDDDCVIDETNVDKYVALWTEEGLSHLRMLRFKAAGASFNKVYQIKPDAYLWQDGIVRYYLGDYHGAAESLARNAERYEARFMEPASEERIWRDAAELKVISSLNAGRRVLKDIHIPAAMRVAMDDNEEVESVEMESILSERRKVIKIARQLFSCSLRNDEAGVALARAQLQACCGDSFPPSLKSTLPMITKDLKNVKTASSSLAKKDHKMYKLHSFFYLGLHYDALGQSYESKQCMKMALKTCANSISGNNQDITYLLPVIHMTVRDWYDDDDFDEEEEEDTKEIDMNDENLMEQFRTDGSLELEFTVRGDDDNSNIVKRDKTTSASSQSTPSRLRDSIKDMKLVDLKNELKARKLKVSGSKRELQDRLVEDLKKDTGAN